MPNDTTQETRTPAHALPAQEPDRTPVGHRLPVAFIPSGEHILRWFCDPQGKHWRLLHIHEGRHIHRGKRGRTLCPDFCRKIDPTGEYPSCMLCTLAAQRKDRRLRCEEFILFYSVLYHTSHPSQYWQTGRNYVTISSTEIRAGLIQLLSRGSDEQRKHFFAMLNPTLPSPAMIMQVKKGPQASVVIPAFTTETFPPLALGDWYGRLQDCWLPRFNLADYHAMLAAVTGAQSTSS